MPTFKGNTATTATSTAYNIPSKIISFSIVNKTGGAATVNAGILFGSTVDVIPLNKSLAAGESYFYSGSPIFVPANSQIYFTASANCDYYFSIE